MVLVANPAACGEGISLHKVCHHAIYLDRNYNAAQYLQSEDRIHRLGLKKNQHTYVEIVCCKNSIDVSVHDRLRRKVARMADVLNDDGLNIDPISFDPDFVNGHVDTDLIQPVYVRTTKIELNLPPLNRKIKEISMSPAQWRRAPPAALRACSR